MKQGMQAAPISIYGSGTHTFPYRWHQSLHKCPSPIPCIHRNYLWLWVTFHWITSHWVRVTPLNGWQTLMIWPVRLWGNSNFAHWKIRGCQRDIMEKSTGIPTWDKRAREWPSTAFFYGQCSETCSQVNNASTCRNWICQLLRTSNACMCHIPVCG